MELLVAISVSLGLILFVGQIMDTTTDAISSGFDTSELLQNSRVLTEALDSDALLMQGPSGNGVLMIASQTVPSRVLESDQTDADVRADQIMFIRFRGSLEPLCPGSSNNYSNNTGSAGYVRVWYGHCQQVQRNGLAASTNAKLGEAGVNRFASKWVLGRQAIFLASSPTTTQLYSSHPTGSTNLGARYDAQLKGAAGAYFTDAGGCPYKKTGQSGSEPMGRLYHGLNDVVDQTLAELDADIHPAGALDTAIAAEYLYVKERLHVNPEPELGNLEPWRIGQMHPQMLRNVSDITIEFAGDYVDDIDEDGDPMTTELDGKPDVDGSGNLIWYSVDNIPVGPVTTPFELPGIINPLASTAINSGTDATVFIFTRSNPNAWPYFIRMRYRMHDRNGKMTGSDGEPGRIIEQVIGVNRN